MKKRSLKHISMLNMKGLLYLIAFAVWVFVMMKISDTLNFSKDTLFSYGGSTVLIILILYIAIVLMELLIDIEDLD